MSQLMTMGIGSSGPGEVLSVIFEDGFSQPEGELSTLTPDTTGDGYTNLIQVASGEIEANSGTAIASTGANTGVLYTCDATYSSADYFCEITQSVSGASDEQNIIAVRVQDANNMYALLYNEDGTQLYKRVSGTWSTIGSLGTGVNDTDTVKIEISGTTLRTLINDIEDASETVTDHASAGKAAIGMGAVINANDDMGVQEWNKVKIQEV